MNMRESHLRSIIKAVSWRIFGTLSTVLIAFLITHKLSLSFYIGMLEFISKVGLFYLHERIWTSVNFGSK
jgi:uncharacterized membrane protein